MTDGDEWTVPIRGLNDDEIFGGMSIREYFAAQAMKALLAIEYSGEMSRMDRMHYTVEEIACQHADSLINALNK